MDNSRDSFPVVDLREQAVYMLTQAAPMMDMTPDEARLVLDVMRPVHLMPDT